MSGANSPTSKKVMDWIRWLFRRGSAPSIVLNMAPADYIVSMLVFRNYLVVCSRGGEMYFLDGERLVEFSQAEIQVGRSMQDVPRW